MGLEFIKSWHCHLCGADIKELNDFRTPGKWRADRKYCEKCLRVSSSRGRPIEKFKGKFRRIKTGFNETELRRIEAMASLGLTQPQISAILGVPFQTFWEFTEKNPKIKEAMEKGNARAALAVTRAAYNMAVSEQFPQMTMFYLKSRYKWEDKHEIEYKGDPIVQDNRTQVLASVTPEDVRALAKHIIENEADVNKNVLSPEEAKAIEAEFEEVGNGKRQD